MMQVQEWGGLWTTAIPVHHNPHLWNILSYNCESNNWKAAVNEYGIVAASRTLIVEETSRFVKQQVISNGFNAQKHSAYGMDYINTNSEDNYHF
jgi:hypothetical protein